MWFRVWPGSDFGVGIFFGFRISDFEVRIFFSLPGPEPAGIPSLRFLRSQAGLCSSIATGAQTAMSHSGLRANRVNYGKRIHFRSKLPTSRQKLLPV